MKVRMNDYVIWMNIIIGIQSMWEGRWVGDEYGMDGWMNERQNGWTREGMMRWLEWTSLA